MSTPEGSLGILDRLLTFVDAPWKIIAVAALAMIGVATVTLWEKRAQIAESILHTTVSPRLEVAQFTKVVPPVMDDTGADLAVLLSVHLQNNIARVVAGIRRGDPHWVPSSAPRPIFNDNNAEAVIRLLEGSTPECSNVSQSSPGQLGRDMAGLGITRLCIISVPPIVDILVGALGFGWKTPPDALHEQGAKIEMRRVAQKLATW